MHAIIDKKFYLGPEYGTLINKKWITISELLQSWTFVELILVTYYTSSGATIFLMP
jgi:hypothetical protein